MLITESGGYQPGHGEVGWVLGFRSSSEGVLVAWKSAKRATVEPAPAAACLLQLHDTTKMMQRFHTVGVMG